MFVVLHDRASVDLFCCFVVDSALLCVCVSLFFSLIPVILHVTYTLLIPSTKANHFETMLLCFRNVDIFCLHHLVKDVRKCSAVMSALTCKNNVILTTN